MVCQTVVLGLGEDKLCWDLDESGSFNVKSVKWHVVNERGVMPEFVFKWNSWVPKKVNLVVWRAGLDRLPTWVALAAQNINVPLLDCAFCGDHNESVEHIFVSCGLAQAVWHAISYWCQVPAIYAFRVRDLLELHKFSSIPKKKAKVFYAIMLVALWRLWKARNEVVHDGAVIHAARLVEEIKVISFLYVRNRAKITFVTWEDWKDFSF
ncbi:uncharacterized protein LOC143615131 [Bidens hawaiensis]|uniref:uncharacterized protein LOC143615131 n=1 Tax=Bidens hawaiensis TaxID=980011 RepID=UPI00404A891D